MDMYPYKPFFRKALVAGVAVCFLTLASSAFAISQKLSIEQTGWADPITAQYAIDYGRSLVTHLQSARSLLNGYNISDSRKELKRSTEIAKAIEHLVPYMAIEEKLNSAIKNLKNGKLERYFNDLPPIYSNLDELAIYAPLVVNTVRNEVQKSEKHARNGAPDLAVLDLKEVWKGVFSNTLYIPVFYVDSQVQAANKALQKHDPDVTSARREINNALDSLLTDVDEHIDASPQG